MGEDEDKEKAEKVAAARKRYEQMKKDKAKKGTKMTGDSSKSNKPVEEDAKAKDELDEPPNGEDEKKDDPPKLDRKDSVAQESRKRSESFRKASDTVSEEAKESHKKNTARIEELEKRNEQLEKDLDAQKEELDQLKTKPADSAAPAAGMSAIKSKLEAARAKSQTHARTKSQSQPSDLTAQLSQKQSALESLELELSTLRHTLTTTEQKCADLETRAKEAEAAAASSEQRLSDLKSSLSQPPSPKDSKTSEPNLPDDPSKRIALLTADLSAAQSALSQSTTKITTLEAKAQTLTKLHQDSETQHTAQTRSRIAELEAARAEIATLKKRLASAANENTRLRASDTAAAADDNVDARPERKSVSGDALGLDELEDERAAALDARVRALEAENFELRRGVWLARRASLQGEMPGGGGGGAGSPGGGGFDDVDLGTPGGPLARGPGSGQGVVNAFGTFVNAFNKQIGDIAGGGQQVPREGGHAARASLDDDFDEGAFAAASEAETEARRAEDLARAERVKEVKRGLEKWRGYRVDIVDLRGGGMAGVFDV